MDNNIFEAEFLKKLTKPTVIALDLDLTLHDVIEHYDYSVNETLVHFGYDKLTQAQLDEASGDSFTNTKDLFAKFLPEALLSSAVSYYYNHFLSREIPVTAVLPGSKVLLETLQNKFDIPIVGVTNSEERIAKKILKDLNFFDWFDFVVGIKENTPSKPDPFMLRKALMYVNNVPGPHVWFVGDKMTDTKCAKAVDCTAIRFYHKQKPHDQYADFYINDHLKFVQLIAKVLNCE